MKHDLHRTESLFCFGVKSENFYLREERETERMRNRKRREEKRNGVLSGSFGLESATIQSLLRQKKGGDFEILSSFQFSGEVA